MRLDLVRRRHNGTLWYVRKQSTLETLVGSYRRNHIARGGGGKPAAQACNHGCDENQDHQRRRDTGHRLVPACQARRGGNAED
jgi:hypothetical protein